MELEPVKFDTAAFARPVFKASAQYLEDDSVSVSAFSSALNKAVSNLNDVQRSSRIGMEDFAAGADIEVHEVMMGIEKADLTMNLALQVRNKILEGYNDIIRMQI